jgi:hypothetical protein
VTPLCTLRRALSDPKLLGSVLAGDSWQAWRVVLIAACGEPLSDDERVIFKRLTGREREPGERVDELAAVVGRRGGKSRALATLAVYIAALCQHRLVPGERGLVLIVAQNQRAARVVLHYAEACFDAAPALAALVVSRSGDSIVLSSGVQLEVRWQSFRAVRGFTLCAAVCDEVAFWWDGDNFANPDRETVNAIRPGLATTGGPLILASSPYARRGVLWDAYRRYYGNNEGVPLRVLVVPGATRDLNSTVPQAWIDAELARDPARNRAEYLAEFRTDVEGFVALEVVEAAVGDFSELLPAAQVRYHAFCDPAGGSGIDSFTLAVAHRDADGNAVIDAVRERRPPFSPGDVIAELSRLLKSYRITQVTGDRFAGGFASEAFNRHGIRYQPAARTKSDAYVDLLPLLNSGSVVLPRNERLVAQLVGLERRTARGTGRDIVDHPPGGHDDLSNAVAGAALLARKPAYDTSLAWIDGSPIGDPSSHDTRRSMGSR